MQVRQVNRPLAFVIIAFACLRASASDMPRLTLSLRNSTTLDMTMGAYEVPIKCGADGSIYVRGYQRSDPTAAPVLKFGADGNKAGIFSFDTVPEFVSGKAVDYAVGLDGDVYVLGYNDKENLLVAKFDKQGKYKFSMPLTLSHEFSPSHMGLFSSGEFLLTGTVIDSQTSGKTAAPVPQTILLDKNGRFVRRVDAKEKFQTGTNGEVNKEDLEAEQLTAIVTGDDGNVYVMLPKSKPVILSLSSAGDLHRKFTVDSPGDTFAPVTMKEGGGRIVVVFEAKRPPGPRTFVDEIYRIFDSDTGKFLFDYIPGPELRGAFACYVPPSEFRLLASKDDGLFLLQTATPR